MKNSSKDLDLTSCRPLTVQRLKEIIKDLPDETPVLVERVPDYYFSDERSLGERRIEPMGTFKLRSIGSAWSEQFLKDAAHDIEVFKRGGYTQADFKMSYPSLELLEQHYQWHIENDPRDEFILPEGGFYSSECKVFCLYCLD